LRFRNDATVTRAPRWLDLGPTRLAARAHMTETIGGTAGERTTSDRQRGAAS
jgi:hypothetical protein